MNYLEEVQKGMDLLASHPDTIFIGQAMTCKGHAVSHQVKNYPLEKRLEFPVAEDFQSGFCLGAALNGYIPVSIYPRNDFAILACNSIINHIDKWNLMHGGNPKVIIKMLVGSTKPMNPGHQHKANYAEEFKHMTKTIAVFNLWYPEKIFFAYQRALEYKGSVILVEYAEKY